MKFGDNYVNNLKNVLDIKLIFFVLAPLLIIAYLNIKLFLLLLFFSLELFSTYFEKIFHIEPGPDFILCGIILFAYSGNLGHAFMLAPFIIVTKIFFGRFKLRHLIKPLIYVIIAYMAFLLSAIPIVILGVILNLTRYLLEYLVTFAISGNVSFDRLFERILKIIFSYIFFMLFADLILKLI